MTTFEALLLGIIQGFTEFLPISSSGHLVFAQYFLKINAPTLAFDVFIHFTTLFAIILYFSKDLKNITRRELTLLAVGTLPAVFVGLFLKDWVELAFNSIRYVSLELIASGIINFWIFSRLKHHADSELKEVSQLSYKQAILVGIGQAIAISPGISRSGTTVLSGLLNNFSRDLAFRFAFLLAIPAILGATVLEAVDVYQDPTSLQGINLEAFLVGGVAAFIVGLGSLKLFEFVIKKAQMHYFGVYCIVLGLLMFFITS